MSGCVGPQGEPAQPMNYSTAAPVAAVLSDNIIRASKPQGLCILASPAHPWRFAPDLPTPQPPSLRGKGEQCGSRVRIAGANEYCIENA